MCVIKQSGSGLLRSSKSIGGDVDKVDRLKGASYKGNKPTKSNVRHGGYWAICDGSPTPDHQRLAAHQYFEYLRFWIFIIHRISSNPLNFRILSIFKILFTEPPCSLASPPGEIIIANMPFFATILSCTG